MDVHALAELLVEWDGVVRPLVRQNGRSVLIDWVQRRSQQPLGHAGFVLTPAGDVHWSSLWAPRPGTLTHLASVLPAFFRDQGAAYVSMCASAPDNWRWAEAVGFRPVATPTPWMTDEWHEVTGLTDWQERGLTLFACSLKPPCRMEAYAAWQRGERQEPKWHAQVAARRRAKASSGDASEGNE